MKKSFVLHLHCKYSIHPFKNPSYGENGEQNSPCITQIGPSKVHALPWVLQRKVASTTLWINFLTSFSFLSSGSHTFLPEGVVLGTAL